MKRKQAGSRKPTFGVVIASALRPAGVLATEALDNAGYTGPYCVMLADFDTDYELYCAFLTSDAIEVVPVTYGDQPWPNDQMDNRGLILSYLRMYSASVARARGWDYFLCLHDNCESLLYHHVVNGRYISMEISDFDETVDIAVELLETSGITAFSITDEALLARNDDGLMPVYLRRGISHESFGNTHRCLDTDVDCFNMDNATEVAGLMMVTNVISVKKHWENGDGPQSYLGALAGVCRDPSTARAVRDGSSMQWEIKYDTASADPKIVREVVRKDR